MNNALSSIIAGTMLWGRWGQNFDTSQMAEHILFCHALGITSFDHADIYGDYTTEQAFGLGLTASKIEREKIQLISKCGIKLIHEKKGYQVKHYDYSFDHIINSCQQSLLNLQTDYIDVFLLHRPSPLMDVQVVADAIIQLKSENKIKSFGLSNFTPSQTEMIRQKLPVEYNQIQFSVTHHDAMLDGQLDYMALHQIQCMAWAPLGDVFKNQSVENTRITKVLKTLAKKYNIDEEVVLLWWIRQHPANIIPIIGTTKKERIKKMALAMSPPPLEHTDWFLLWQAAMGNEVP